MLEKTVRMSLLFDFYGQLLTERQREFFALYHDNDLSLGEIAAQFDVSRQAVYDILKRSTRTLDELEAKLELVRRHEEQQERLRTLDQELQEIEEAVRRVSGLDGTARKIRGVRRALQGW